MVTVTNTVQVYKIPPNKLNTLQNSTTVNCVLKNTDIHTIRGNGSSEKRSMQRHKRDGHKTLVPKPKGKRPPGRPTECSVR